MSDLIPVEGNHALYRDSQSNAIVSTDMSEYKKYIESRDRRRSQKNEMDKVKSELDSMKDDISEIKGLLRSLVNGN